MFLKVSSFHWQGLAGPALAVVGLALLIATGSLFLYFRGGRGRAPVGEVQGESQRLKRLGIFGGLLIGFGLAAFAVLGGGQALSEKYEFISPAKTEVGRIYYQPLIEEVIVPLSQMIRKSGARVMKEPDRIDITRNAYIETPFVFIGGSRWALEFTASGTEADGEKSRILAATLELNETGTSAVGPYSIYELKKEPQIIRIPIRLSAGKIAAVRIDFLNALNIKKNPVRVVTVTDIAFKKQ